MAITHDTTVTGVQYTALPATQSTLATGTFTSVTDQLAVVVGTLFKGSPGLATWHATTPLIDSKGNTWTQIGSEHVSSGANNQRVRKYWARLVNAGTLHTITMAASANTEMTLVVDLFSGTDLTSPVESESSLEITVATATFTAPSVTTLDAHDLVLGWGTDDNDQAWTATAPQTKGSNVGAHQWYGAAISYDIKSATGSFTPAWTLGATDTGWVGAIVIKPAAAAASTANDSLPNLGSGLYPPVGGGLY